MEQAPEGSHTTNARRFEMRKHRALIAMGLALIVLVPAGVAYGLTRATTVIGTRASCIDWAAVTTPATTTSTAWTDVPGMTVKDTLAQNFTVQISGTFDGSDVQVRVVDATVGGTSALAPGATTIRAASGPTAASFTWVGQNPSEHQHTFRLQWRLPSTGSATMSAGDVSLLYQGAPTPSSC
jgi:hypothetical protein